MLQISYYRVNLIVFVIFHAFLAGCAFTNEGATDYRFFGNNGSNTERGKYIKPINAHKLINPGDPLVVSIKHAYINEFHERNLPWEWPAIGEVAIVVNAFEKGGVHSLDFSSDGKNNARVVFFSDDVKKGQSLNLANLSTIYGPLKYEGSPFMLDLYVIELDTPGEQMRQLVSNLAAIGSTFYPPASPLAGPLAKLANTFITDDQDDKAYHYTIELRPVGGDPGLNTGMLQAGNYAFIREEKRNETTQWEKLKLDENTAKIVYKRCTLAADSNEYPEDCYYKDNSYIVLEINTAASSLANDTQQMVYSRLASKLSKESAPILNEVVSEDNLTKLAQGIAATKSADIINAGIQTLESSDTLPKKRIAGMNVIDDWCGIDSGMTIQDKRRIEKRFLTLVESCENEVSHVYSIMDVFKDHQNCSSSDKKAELVQAISCENKH